MRWAFLAVGLGLVLLVSLESAFAHSGAPALARMLNPDQPGEIADTQYTFRWTDSDAPTPTGSASIAFFYTPILPPPFPPEQRPPLDGVRIVHSIPEPDLQNRYTWNTSTVPPGAYFIWSVVEEPPQEVASIQIISYSPQVLHVAHPGDVLTPSVVLLTPDTPFRFSDDHYLVKYSAFDPSGTGRVRIEGTRQYDSTGFRLLADDLPAVADGSFNWDTHDIEEGNWTLRASITDRCARRMQAHARYFLSVSHVAGLPDGGHQDASEASPLDAVFDEAAACGRTTADLVPEAGVMDAAATAPDLGTPDAGTIGPEPPAAEGGGCGCSSSARAADPWLLGLLLLAGLLRLRAPASALGMRRLAILCSLVAFAPWASADPDAGTKPVEADKGEIPRDPGTVLTYYGLRKLELDAAVSDAEKVQQWQAFIERATEQIAYAKTAVVRWKDAARMRILESAEAAEKQPEVPANEKIAAWAKVQELFAKTPDGKNAEKHIAQIRAAELKRLGVSADEVERSRAQKVDRVRAWRAVVEWSPKSPEAKAAEKRMTALMTQLFQEAQDLDRIRRVDVETRLTAWRDVLDGAPTKEQKKTAEKRILELSAEAGAAKKPAPEASPTPAGPPK
ncbi:MAG: hypothetical protein U1E65_01910 [Myxococcota bacterium]